MLDELVGAGKVGAVGASNVTGEQLAEALELSELEGLTAYGWVQNSYSLLERAVEEDVFPVCREHGLGFTPFSPLCGGWLTGKYRRDEELPAGSRMTLRPGPYEHLRRAEVFDALEALETEAGERGTTTATLALAWLIGQAQVTAIVVGPRRPEHLEPALAALQLDLSPTDRDRIGAFFP